MTCKGACTTIPALRGVPYVAGRPPNDPFTGVQVAPGTYGPWKRCRTCAVMIIWQGIFCPCCGFRIAARPRASARRRSARAGEARIDGVPSTAMAARRSAQAAAREGM